mmetsp:Transcript_7712/g.8759  ORF Transcript_7712/g.8759 Transcript_7712/m.8759 type:complete len:92 (+) Transcript_7712:249-524(+)
MGKELQAKLHGKNEVGSLDVTLIPSDSADDSINAKLLREGLATIPRKAKAWKKEAQDIMATLKEAQESAHKDHIRMWLYGDPRNDDDDQRF